MADTENKEPERRNFVKKAIYFWVDMVVKPVVWVRENIVEPNQKEYYWYHERLPRVPTVDQCYTDDYVCIYEAQEQFLRDKKVDEQIVKILKKRFEFCSFENNDEPKRCADLKEAWKKAQLNYFIKYSDLGMKDSVISCYMKQKHRMAFERRHGPVGSGRKIKAEE